MLKTFRNLVDLLKYKTLVNTRTDLVFYSEGGTYWPYLKGIIQYLLNYTDIEFSYVTSNNDDPGLKIKNKKVSKFNIGYGSCRTWFFANLDCKVIVMTMLLKFEKQ